MNTKIATSIEQSKRLLEAGVPKESADFCWRQNFDIEYGYPVWKEGHFLSMNPSVYLAGNPTNEFPAWSLSALWQRVHELDKTYEFPSSLSADELIETLTSTICYRQEHQ